MSKHSNRSGSSVASGRSTGSNTNTKPSPDVVLGVGMSVFVNKEMGVVRYIGKTEFDDGVWIGVELRKPSTCISVTETAVLKLHFQLDL